MRETLAPLGQFDLQEVGAPVSQEYIAKVEAKSEDQSFQTTTQDKIMGLLNAKYGAGQVILKRTDFVGPRLAQGLVTQTIWLVLIAVALILVYMIFRFHPPIYAVAAVIGICHDALVMIAFDAVFRVEVDAATIAAILTILGYSINDTIVIFDRVRENKNLMRGSPLRTILDTSVTQTLSRTFITSGATLLTVIALFILTSGSIKNFALNMIVGIVEGTYSTFISSFIVLEWTRAKDKRQKTREMERYGVHVEEKAVPVVGAALSAGAQVTYQSAEADGEEEVEEPLEGSAPEPVAAPQGAGSVAGAQSAVPGSAGQAVPRTVPVQQASQPSGQTAGQHTAPAPVLFGHSGSRKNKKHKRRHH